VEEAVERTKGMIAHPELPAPPSLTQLPSSSGATYAGEPAASTSSDATAPFEEQSSARSEHVDPIEPPPVQTEPSESTVSQVEPFTASEPSTVGGVEPPAVSEVEPLVVSDVEPSTSYGRPEPVEAVTPSLESRGTSGEQPDFGRDSGPAAPAETVTPSAPEPDRDER
jgi:hypothetical protein